MHGRRNPTTEAERAILADKRASPDTLRGSSIRQTLGLGLPIDSSSVVLENACGFGRLTYAIQDLLYPEARPQVHAGDVEPEEVLILELIARKKQWTRYESAVMDASHLEFPDNMFTHSYMCYAIFVIRELEIAAAEIYRTLRPSGVGGVGSVNRVDWPDSVLKDIGHMEQADPLDEDYKALLHFAEWNSGEKVVEVMVKGGFEPEKVKLGTVVVYLHDRDGDRYLRMYIEAGSISGPYKLRGDVTVEQRECQRRFSLAIDELKVKDAPLGIQTAVVGC